MKIGGGWVVGLSADPAEKGFLYVRTDDSGAYRWEPQSATWKQAPGIDVANNAGLGKGITADYPALYVAGSAKGGASILRSTDRRETWDRIAEYPLGTFDSIDAMDGDKDIFGQVTVYFSGPGFAYGKPVSEMK